jgi:hypothetical protein
MHGYAIVSANFKLSYHGPNNPFPIIPFNSFDHHLLQFLRRFFEGKQDIDKFEDVTLDDLRQPLVL